MSDTTCTNCGKETSTDANQCDFCGESFAKSKEIPKSEVGKLKEGREEHIINWSYILLIIGLIFFIGSMFIDSDSDIWSILFFPSVIFAFISLVFVFIARGMSIGREGTFKEPTKEEKTKGECLRYIGFFLSGLGLVLFIVSMFTTWRLLACAGACFIIAIIVFMQAQYFYPKKGWRWLEVFLENI